MSMFVKELSICSEHDKCYKKYGDSRELFPKDKHAINCPNCNMLRMRGDAVNINDVETTGISGIWPKRICEP